LVWHIVRCFRPDSVQVPILWRQKGFIVTDEPDHPAFPQPDDQNASIWRYMDVEKFEWLVINRRLFMTPALHLGDPREGLTPKGEDNRLLAAIEQADSDESRRIAEHNRQLLTKMTNAFRREYYVSCWHKNECENQSMWDCYTTSSEAVAVRTKYVSLRSSLPSFVGVGEVRYIDRAVEHLSTRRNILEWIMHKDVQFTFESEVRAVALRPLINELGAKHFDENFIELLSSPGFYLYAPQIEVCTLLECVVLHPHASTDFEKRIIKLCESHNLTVPVRSKWDNADCLSG